MGRDMDEQSLSDRINRIYRIRIFEAAVMSVA
jgi:hypothetical protein